MGFGEEEVRCAVVICEMVEARCAGVAFSCDPATGRRDLILIDGAEGLGEAVVSGRVNPERMIWRNQCGRVFRESGCAAVASLPGPLEEELAHLVERMHWALGEGREPQDVEWAYDGEHLWVLQARPVTSMPRVGWPQTAALPRYWSTANIKDDLPAYGAELSWSSLSDIVGAARSPHRKQSDIRSLRGMKWFAASMGEASSISPGFSGPFMMLSASCRRRWSRPSAGNSRRSQCPLKGPQGATARTSP